MANGNIDSAFGLRRRASMGGSVEGQLQTMLVPSTDASPLFMGSPVKLAGGADPVEKVPTITLAAPGDVVFGVVSGFRPDYRGGLNNDNKWRAASTERYVMVEPIFPGCEYEVQVDAAIAVADVGQLYDLTAESGNQVTGRSTVELDVATAGTASGQVRLIRVVTQPDNDYADAADAIVVFNEALLIGANAGV